MSNSENLWKRAHSNEWTFDYVLRSTNDQISFFDSVYVEPICSRDGERRLLGLQISAASVPFSMARPIARVMVDAEFEEIDKAKFESAVARVSGRKNRSE